MPHVTTAWETCKVPCVSRVEIWRKEQCSEHSHQTWRVDILQATFQLPHPNQVSPSFLTLVPNFVILMSLTGGSLQQSASAAHMRNADVESQVLQEARRKSKDRANTWHRIWHNTPKTPTHSLQGRLPNNSLTYINLKPKAKNEKLKPEPLGSS